MEIYIYIYNIEVCSPKCVLFPVSLHPFTLPLALCHFKQYCSVFTVTFMFNWIYLSIEDLFWQEQNCNSGHKNYVFI